MIEDKLKSKITVTETHILVETDDSRRMPGVVTLPVYEGDTFTARVRWKNRGQDEPLTGWSGTASWKTALSGGSVIQAFGTAELSLSTAEPWVITLTVGSATTAGWSGWTRGVGDLRMEHATYGRRTILQMEPLLMKRVA